MRVEEIFLSLEGGKKKEKAIQTKKEKKKTREHKENVDQDFAICRKKIAQIMEAPPAATNHFVSFDYDDTLLCSTFLSGLGLKMDSSRQDVVAKVGPQLSRLAKSVCALLEGALQMTPNIFVVTNAEKGWVEMSARLFMPEALPLLERCTIISARSTFEAAFGDSPLKWKYHAFCECLLRLQPIHTARNVISLGDSHVEREAIRAATRGHAATTCKSIKFAERPSCEQLVRQQELALQCFHYIFSHNDHLDLQLTVTQTPEPEPDTPPIPSSPPLLPQSPKINSQASSDSDVSDIDLDFTRSTPISIPQKKIKKIKKIKK